MKSPRNLLALSSLAAFAFLASCGVARGPAAPDAGPAASASAGNTALCPRLGPLADRVDARARARAAALEVSPTPSRLVVVGAGWAGTIAAACARDPGLLLLGQPDTWHLAGDFRAGQHRAAAPCLPKQPADFEFASFRPGVDYLHAATIGAAVLHAQEALDLAVAYEKVTAIRRAPEGAAARYAIEIEHGQNLLTDRVVLATGVGDSNLLSPDQIDPGLDASLRASIPPVIASETAFLASLGATCGPSKAAAVDDLGDVLVYGAGASGGQIAEALGEVSHHTISFAGPEAALASLRGSLGGPGHRLERLFARVDAGAIRVVPAEAILHVTQEKQGAATRLRVEVSHASGPPTSIVVDRLVTAISQNQGRTRSLFASFAALHLSPVAGQGARDPSVRGVPVALRVDGEEIYLAGAVMGVVSPERAPWGMTPAEAKGFWARYRAYYEQQPDPDARIPTGFLVVGPLLEDLMGQLGR
jgi:dienelactone hydrolase